MAHLSIQLLDEKIIVPDTLIQVRLIFQFPFLNIFFYKDIYNLGPFPTPFLAELRQKYSEQSINKQTSIDQWKSKVTIPSIPFR